MIDQLILQIGSKYYIFMLTETALFIAEGQIAHGFFVFNPAERMEIRPVSWQARELFPLDEHETELRMLRWLEMQLIARKEQYMEEAN